MKTSINLFRAKVHEDFDLSGFFNSIECQKMPLKTFKKKPNLYGVI